MLKIVADAAIPFLEGVLEPYARVSRMPGHEISAQAVHDADILLIRTRTRCDAGLLDGSRVKLIATATIGHDHIDRDYCAEREIEVVTAAGCNARGVLQYVTAAWSRLSLRDGWNPEERTVGVVGVGHVGSLVAAYATQFGFRVLCCDPPRMEREAGLGFLPLGELLERSDIVTLHVPLTTKGVHKTFRMAGKVFFEVLKKGSRRHRAVFINTSRGEVVEDSVLLGALEEGTVAHACIDTWNHEPEIDPGLLRAATLATPHIAGYSIQGKAAGTAAVVRAVARRFGIPLTEWYPPQVTPVQPRPEISWEEVQRRMPGYFDIERESAALKRHPELFEAMRNDYPFRTEFF